MPSKAVSLPTVSRPSRRSSTRRRRSECSVAFEHDLAGHASLPQQLLRLSGLGQRKTPRDQRLDLFLLKQVKQSDQILSKQFRFLSFKPLDAVRDDAFAAREKPAAGDVHP